MSDVGSELRQPSRRRATLIGLINQYGSVALAMVQGVVLVPIYLSHIDDRLYGAWLASGNIIAWLAFIDPGVSGVIQQRVSVSYGKRDLARVSRGIGTGLFVNLAFAILVGALGVALSPWVPRIAGLDPSVATSITLNFALASVAESLLLCALALASVLMALMARPLVLGLTYQACTLFGIVATVVLLHRGAGLSSIPVGLMCRALPLLLANALLASRSLRELNLRPSFSGQELREVFGLSGYTWVSRLGTGLLQNIDAVLVSRHLGSQMVAPLTLSRRAADVLGQFTTRAASAFAPALSHVHGEGDTARLREISLRLLRGVSWLSALALAGFVGLNRSFMALWVGERFYGGSGLTVLLGFALMWQSLSSVFTQTLFAVGAIRRSSVVTLTEALLKAVIIWGLLHTRLGLLSAPLGALVAGLGFSLVALSRAFTRAMGLSPREVRGLAVGSMVQTVLMAALGFGFDRLCPMARTVPSFVLQALGLGALALGVLAAINRPMRDELWGLGQKLRRRGRVEV